MRCCLKKEKCSLADTKGQWEFCSIIPLTWQKCFKVTFKKFRRYGRWWNLRFKGLFIFWNAWLRLPLRDSKYLCTEKSEFEVIAVSRISYIITTIRKTEEKNYGYFLFAKIKRQPMVLLQIFSYILLQNITRRMAHCVLKLAPSKFRQFFKIMYVFSL